MKNLLRTVALTTGFLVVLSGCAVIGPGVLVGRSSSALSNGRGCPPGQEFRGNRCKPCPKGHVWGDGRCHKRGKGHAKKYKKGKHRW